MSIFTKEVLSADSPALVGLKHFILVAAIGVVFTSIAGLVLTAAILFLAYSDNGTILFLMLGLLLVIVVALATLILRKKIRASKKPNQVALWSFFYVVITSVFLMFARESHLGISAEDVAAQLVLLAGAFIPYCVTTILVTKLGSTKKN